MDFKQAGAKPYSLVIGKRSLNQKGFQIFPIPLNLIVEIDGVFHQVQMKMVFIAYANMHHANL